MISPSNRWPTAEATCPRSAEAGFTLLELLVVVIVLGIFVTIVVPRFASSREKAFDAAAKSELRNAMSAQESYFTDAQTYTTEVGASGLDLTSLPAVTVTIPSADASGYMMTAKHGSSPNTYCIDSDVGEIVPGTTC